MYINKSQLNLSEKKIIATLYDVDKDIINIIDNRSMYSNAIDLQKQSAITRNTLNSLQINSTTFEAF